MASGPAVAELTERLAGIARAGLPPARVWALLAARPGPHLTLRPASLAWRVVLLNSLMNVILAAGKHDQAIIDARVDPASVLPIFMDVTRHMLRAKPRVVADSKEEGAR